MSLRPRRPCIFYQRNACSFGDACLYLHSTSAPTPAPTTSPVCPHFLLGRCRFGDQCRQLHPAPAQADLPSSDKSSGLAAPPCWYFKHSSCTKGADCAFSHGSGEVPPALFDTPRDHHHLVDHREIKQAAESNWRNRENPDDELSKNAEFEFTDRSFYNANIRFGPGALVLRVITAFESRHVLISNIPSSASDTDIIHTVSAATGCSKLLIHRSSLSPIATGILEFDDTRAAAEAAPKVNRITIGGNVLSGRLDLATRAIMEDGQGVFRARKVNLTWYGPRMSAFVHYPSAASAEENARRLNGKAFQGYKINTSFRPPPIIPVFRRQRFRVAEIHTVMIRNLPLDTSEKKLTEFCHAKSVALDPPRCPQDSAIQMRKQLERFGSIESFEVLPMTKASSKITAFGQFRDSDAAAAAETGLRTTPPRWLSGTPFFIQRSFSVKYSLRRGLFERIQGAVDLLAQLHQGMIRYYVDEDPHPPVIVVLHGPEPKALGQIKVELDKLTQGELFVVDGKKAWDDFFDTVAGQAFVELLNAEAFVFVQCDSRTRSVRLFGPEIDRALVRSSILQKIEEIRVRRHVLPLQKELVRVLLKRRLRELQNEFGAERLVFDVVSRTLTIDGDENDVRRIRAEISTLQLGGVTSYPSNGEAGKDVLCPVCFCDVEDPVKLGCGHSYCRECLQHYLRPASQDQAFSARGCVAEITADQKDATRPCDVNIPYNTIRLLLSSAEEEGLLLTSFLAHINEHPTEFRYCPSADCQMVYRPGSVSLVGTPRFQCPSCLIQICPACNVEFHEGMSCGEHRDNLTGGVEALAKWREAHGVKQCPNCHADIEKNGGCNHMECFLCKTHICWVCMKTFGDRDIDTSQGIYSHMRREHGGM
ncbi:hypothetical protein C8J57DRAFT_1046014 [Mycena rebaudengoi]|nr:hypothetical protein C8J57DRAFT_1046014 [Mycena rebaudengoi]